MAKRISFPACILERRLFGVPLIVILSMFCVVFTHLLKKMRFLDENRAPDVSVLRQCEKVASIRKRGDSFAHACRNMMVLKTKMPPCASSQKP